MPHHPCLTQKLIFNTSTCHTAVTFHPFQHSNNCSLHIYHPSHISNTMGKQGKSKQPIGNKGKASSRPGPYAKKAKVDVTYDGPSSSTSKSGPSKAIKNGKGKPATTTKPAPPASKAKTAAPVPAVAKSEPTPKTQNKGKGKSTLPTHSTTFIIIAGTYEKLLYGVEGSFPSSSKSSSSETAIKPTLEPIFIFPAHLACVKAVAASPGGKWLATGSEDEFVKVWDLRRRKEVGSLSQHTGECCSLLHSKPWAGRALFNCSFLLRRTKTDIFGPLYRLNNIPSLPLARSSHHNL